MNTKVAISVLGKACMHCTHSQKFPKNVAFEKVIIDHFYIALFSALKQTHCACMWFYMSK